LEEKLVELDGNFDVVCDDPRVNCPEEAIQSGGVVDDSGSMSMTGVYIALGIAILAALIGVLLVRGGSNAPDLTDEVKWDAFTLPAHDTVANSMYGGAADIFQQPVAPAPQPVVAPLPVAPAPVVAAPATPPLPPGGLPAGWTMEQWNYYGWQYLDQLQ